MFTIFYECSLLLQFSLVVMNRTEDHPPDTETVFILFVSLCGILQAGSQTRYFSGHEYTKKSPL